LKTAPGVVCWAPKKFLVGSNDWLGMVMMQPGRPQLGDAYFISEKFFNKN